MVVGPVMLPSHGVPVTVMVCVSVAVLSFVQSTLIDTVLVPAVTPVTVIVDVVLLPLNPVPTLHA